MVGEWSECRWQVAWVPVSHRNMQPVTGKPVWELQGPQT